ncbi:Ance-3 [Carabus blaptoides fortunei]
MCDQVIARKFPVVLLIVVLGVTANPQLDIPQFSDPIPPQNPPNDQRTNNQFRGDIRHLLQQLDVQGSEQCTNNVAAQWNYETNINQLTQLGALNAQQQYSDFQHAVWDLLIKVSREQVPNMQIWRQVRLLTMIGPAALSPTQLDRYNRLINDMLAIYNGATICAMNEPFRCALRLQPDLVNIMAKSRNWDELQYVWTEWRRKTGQNIKELYEQMVALSNEAAKLNNFTDTAEYWTFPFDSPTFQLDIEDTWDQIKPLYDLLHAYVRRKLRDFYGPERISRQAPLPAHILGNMWAQSWSNILDITIPYPGKDFLDVSQEMNRQGYTPQDMFRIAEDFFVSLNMTAMPLDFWTGSLLEEPVDRAVLCQPSAWDFCNKQDFRIKMCTKVTMKDLIMAHHEMAHIHYFIQYRQQPKVFRDGANPGFHEAIGEAIALSVGTPKHLQYLGLVQASVDDSSIDINYLYSMALDKVAFLPFALTMDKWRWDVYAGNVNKDEYNCHWWRLREKYSGLKPPVLRSEIDFDPGSKYHIPANIPYIRYFVGTVLQFQLHRAMCRLAGQYDPNDLNKPLHKCDIYRSKEAGYLLSRLMEKGSSVPWPEALFQATGESRMDGSALREYFRPLEDWLRSENLRTQEFVGWVYDGDYCKQSIQTAGLQVYGGFYNEGFVQKSSIYISIFVPALLAMILSFF